VTTPATSTGVKPTVVRRPIEVRLPDQCGGTRLSSFTVQALLHYGLPWFWQQTMHAARTN